MSHTSASGRALLDRPRALCGKAAALAAAPGGRPATTPLAATVALHPLLKLPLPSLATHLPSTWYPQPPLQQHAPCMPHPATTGVQQTPHGNTATRMPGNSVPPRSPWPHAPAYNMDTQLYAAAASMQQQLRCELLCDHTPYPRQNLMASSASYPRQIP